MLCSAKIKNLKSLSHIYFKNSFIKRYIILNPNIEKINEILGIYVITYMKKHELNEVRCLIKILTTRNRIRYNRINLRSYLHHRFYIPKELTLSKINQDRYHFSQIIEMKNNFIRYISHMSYNFYVKQPKSMGETKLNQILSRNPNLINCLDINFRHPPFRKYGNNLFNNCFWEESLSLYKMNIKTNILEDYVNFVNTTKRQNTYFKTILLLFTFIVTLFLFYLSF